MLKKDAEASLSLEIIIQILQGNFCKIGKAYLPPTSHTFEWKNEYDAMKRDKRP